MAALSEELGQKSEEIRKYHAEQTVVFSQIQELIGHPGEFVNKAWLYTQLVESGDPISAQQTILILVKYSRMMNNLFADFQKVVSPSGTPRRVLYQGLPGSPTGTLYEDIGEVAIVLNPPATADPSQQAGGSQPGSSGRFRKMHIRPLQHFRRIARCRSHSLLPHLGRPLPGIPGLLRVDSIRNT